MGRRKKKIEPKPDGWLEAEYERIWKEAMIRNGMPWELGMEKIGELLEGGIKAFRAEEEETLGKMLSGSRKGNI